MLTEPPQFFTATILKWIHLLKEDNYKDIIMQSLKFHVEKNRIILYAFVIMPNHIHLIWQMQQGVKQSDVQRDFLKYTAQNIKFDLLKNDIKMLENFKVNLKDRSYQFWKHKPLSVPLFSSKVFNQKLDYIHNNPLQPKWKLCNAPEDYFYSSAKFYLKSIDDWGFLRHHEG